MPDRRLLPLALAALLGASPLAAVPAAYAASATQNAYGEDDVTSTGEGDENAGDDQGVSPDSDSGTADANPSTANGSGNLPFTGLEAGLIGAAGIGLVGTGLVLRRAAREQHA